MSPDAGFVFSAGPCPVCSDSGALLFVRPAEGGAVFVLCPACGVAWADPADAEVLDEIRPPTDFAASGLFAAQREQVLGFEVESVESAEDWDLSDFGPQ